MKINGPLWKYRTYEKFGDAQYQREKALENASKQNFPPVVFEGINAFFDSQTGGMNRCDCCGETVQTLQTLGEAKICKKCFSKINTSAWKETEYESNEEVENNRQKILKIASKNNFPLVAIDGINRYFDNKIQKDLIRIIDNHRGQILKVYKTHCVLVTNDSFNVEEISKKYGKAIKKGLPRENFISNIEAKSLARSILKGGIVGAGINLATSAAINVAADAIAPSKGMFKVVKGSMTINYQEYDQVELQKVGDNEIGFIRFRNSKHNDNPSEDIVFFFGSSEGKEKLYNEICQCIESAKKIQRTVEMPSAPVQQAIPQISVADEILKFKNLLDMGAITQDEFDAKKKELLSL